MAANIADGHKWDIIVRLCHILMISLITGCWYTAENGMMQWHYYMGYGLLTVLFIRLIWGIIGSKPARFAAFIKSPKTVINYLLNIKANNAKNTVSATHSPAGGYSVVVLLSLMFSQTILGLFATETDGFDGGPLSEWIDYDLSLEISELHQLNFDILLGFIALHLVAVLFYQRILKQKLVQKMFF